MDKFWDFINHPMTALVGGFGAGAATGWKVC
jgi:hypothetical protein